MSISGAIQSISYDRTSSVHKKSILDLDIEITNLKRVVYENQIYKYDRLLMNENATERKHFLSSAIIGNIFWGYLCNVKGLEILGIRAINQTKIIS